MLSSLFAILIYNWITETTSNKNDLTNGVRVLFLLVCLTSQWKIQHFFQTYENHYQIFICVENFNSDGLLAIWWKVVLVIALWMISDMLPSLSNLVSSGIGCQHENPSEFMHSLRLIRPDLIKYMHISIYRYIYIQLINKHWDWDRTRNYCLFKLFFLYFEDIFL